MASSRREYFRRTRKVRMRELSHSKPGWIGLICGLGAAVLFLIAVVFSYRGVGEARFYIGIMGLFGLVLSVGGLILGIMGAREEKVRQAPPRIAVVVGAGMTILLAILYLSGF